MIEPGSASMMYHASVFRCAPGLAAAYAASGCTCTDKFSRASRNLIRIGNCPCGGINGTSPYNAGPKSWMISCSVRPASGPLLTPELTQLFDLSITPGG